MVFCGSPSLLLSHFLLKGSLFPETVWFIIKVSSVWIDEKIMNYVREIFL